MTLTAALAESATAWAVLIGAAVTVIATFLATGGKVWRTCLEVARWMQRQEDRWEAVDVVAQDWAERGITPAGAVAEAKRYRDLADVHTSAISEHATRLDEHDERLNKLDHIAAQVDEIAATVRRPA